MRAVIDARPALDPRRTGVGHYTAALIRHLPDSDPGATFVAWYLHAGGLFRPRRFFDDVDAGNLVERASRFPARVFQPLSWRFQVPRVEWLAGEFDVLLATNFLPPATARMGRCVLVVHDLAFERYPETAPQIDVRWRRRFAGALRRCAAVIVPSASSRGDLLAGHPIDGGRVHVVHHGVDASAFEDVPEDRVAAVRRRFGVDGPYILFVGGIEPRKNLVRLVRAFASLDGPVRLVIAGGHVRWIPQEAARVRAAVEALPPGVRSRVVLTGYVRDADKSALVAGAEVVAYPSLHEGFGFPVLEAMAAAVPVLAGNVSSLPEIAGNDALLVDPHREEDIAGGLSRLLQDGTLREALRRRGRERARTFTWEAAAGRTARVLREAAAHAGR